MEKKKHRKKKSNLYFTKVHEDAIIAYSNTDDKNERTKLYVELIQPAFDELVKKIIFTYKFTSLPNIEQLKEECEIWLVTILDKFDPSKGSKAFSYFSVITKNWFIAKVKKTSKQLRREVQYDNMPPEIENTYFSTDYQYNTVREYAEFWEFLFHDMQEWYYEDLKPNENKVLKAIHVLFSGVNNIEIFNKKAVYLYLREITDLNTKQIVTALNKFKGLYKEFRSDWLNGNI